MGFKLLILIGIFGLTSCQLEWEENLLTALSTEGVSEDTPVGTSLGNLRASDPDGSITFRTTTSVLSVNTNTGRVTLAQPLDRETAAAIPVEFYARNGQGGEIPASYTMTVLDVQDTPPLFSGPITIVVPESTPQNTVLATQIRVRDGDRGVPNDLSITISEDPRGLFRLGQPTVSANKMYTVPIITTALVDREEFGSTYTFTVKATEIQGGSETSVTATSQVTVTISDNNDNGPQFNRVEYTISVNEGLTRGTQLPGLGMVVTDADEGDNAYFTLEMRSVSSSPLPTSVNDIYTLSPTEGTSQAAVTLRVNDSSFFNYERPSYRTHVFEIVATETRTTERRSSSARVTVNLRDINDNFPQFTRVQYTYNVQENVPSGSVVAVITATDADGPPNNQLSYSLVGLGSDAFIVNGSTGEIRVRNQLDFEDTSLYELEYRASDGTLVTTVRFMVTVIDVNDQRPIFSAPQYSTFVGETSITMQPPITVQATDADSDLPVTYRIVSGNDLNLFRLDRDTGRLTLTRPVSYSETPDKSGKFELIVEASDNDSPVAQTSTVPVTINVRDTNNNRPVFRAPDSIYRETINEITPIGTSILTVQADDDDAGLNAQIDYIIRSGGRDNFEIDLNSGQINVAPNANLDIDDNGDRYTIIVHAEDRGSPPLTGTATVYINVVDSNNKMPAFGQDLYLLRVFDDAPMNTEVETITAEDPDANPNIRYTIMNNTIEAQAPGGDPFTDTDTFDYLNAFRVEPNSGRILTSIPLSHDFVNLVNFTLMAEDLNAEDPSPQTTTAIVEISILPTGGTDVIFDPPWTPENPVYEVHVAEGSPEGTIFTQLVAQDPLTGGAAITDYREVPGTDPNDYFGVIRETGQIVNNRRLDYETLPQRELTFQVEARTADQRRAVATIRVIVDDINDNYPVFVQDSYPFTVSEGREYPTQVGIVRANDADSGNFSLITYDIIGPGAEMFYIDPMDGEITVAPNMTLDRESRGVYNLEVRATDNPGDGEKKVTSVPLTITIQDENDNAPIFTRPDGYSIYTPDRREKDRIIGQVTARDADAGVNGRVEYRMLTNTPDFELVIRELFYIQTNGTIRSNKAPTLEGYARDAPYVFTVRAEDSGSPRQHNDVTVAVYIQDELSQGGPPVIGYPGEDGERIPVDEELEPGTNITQINASSNDPTVELEYSFVVNDALLDDTSRFRIDPNTGVISVTERLDRELQVEYQLIVMVRDNKGRETVRRIFIRLTDIDDNTPSFDCPGSPKIDPLRASVMENMNDTEVARLQACDPDGSDVPIYFSIIYGNDEDEEFGGEKPFRIERDGTEGVITTNVRLDREHQALYTLIVHASGSLENEEDPLVNITINEESNGQRRKRRQVETGTGSRDDLVTVYVTVLDEDDNGPEFSGQDGSSGPELIAGVLMTSRPGTDIIRVRAHDDDATPTSLYSLEGETFFNRDNKGSSTPLAFVIDPLSGVVETNLEEYIRYVDGYFRMTVVATDRSNRRAEAELIIYVVRETQRLRFVFDRNVDETNRIQKQFLEEVKEFFPEYDDMNADALHYHARNNGKVDFEKSDLCFHVIKDNRVLNVDVALDEFDRMRRRSRELRNTYEDYDVILVDACDIKLTTRWWSGYWWLWWILIAYGIFIFVVALICICIICIWWPRYRKGTKEKTKPYKVLMDQSMPTLPPASEIEWQEDVVKMD